MCNKYFLLKLLKLPTTCNYKNIDPILFLSHSEFYPRFLSFSFAFSNRTNCYWIVIRFVIQTLTPALSRRVFFLNDWLQLSTIAVDPPWADQCRFRLNFRCQVYRFFADPSRAPQLHTTRCRRHYIVFLRYWRVWWFDNWIFRRFSTNIITGFFDGIIKKFSWSVSRFFRHRWPKLRFRRYVCIYHDRLLLNLRNVQSDGSAGALATLAVALRKRRSKFTAYFVKFIVMSDKSFINLLQFATLIV